METWKPIAGWEGLYEVSDAGRVRSVDRIVLAISPTSGKLAPRRFRGRVLRPSVGKNGYAAVSLTAPGRKRLCVYVHDLVAAAFIGPKPCGHEVCHGNGRRQDNSAANLRYDSRSANAMDRRVHGTMNPPRGEAHTWAKLTEKDAAWVRRNVGRLSHRAMGRTLGVCHKTIGAVLAGQSWKHVEGNQ